MTLVPLLSVEPAVWLLASPIKMLAATMPMLAIAVANRHSLPSVQLPDPTAGFFTKKIAGPATVNDTVAYALLSAGNGLPLSVTRYWNDAVVAKGVGVSVKLPSAKSVTE